MLARFSAAASALTIAATSLAGTLGLGDAMPPIAGDADWIQGSPVTEWEDGKVYVVDFWATWCGPCVASIPHVNQLSKEYADKGVSVIGLAIWPRPGMVDTAEYVKQRGDEMSYLIAADVDGKSAEKYMNATGSNGIPTIMIVDQKGRLAWKGHPMSGFDEALEEVVNGTFDMEKAKKTAALQAKSEEFLAAAQRHAGAGEWDDAVLELAKVTDLDIPEAGYFALVKFQVLAAEQQCNKPDEANAYGKTLLTSRFADDAELFASMAGFIAEGPIADGGRDLDLALAAAELSVKTADDDFYGAYSALAAVYNARGEYKKAVEAQNKAIEIATKVGDAEAVKDLEATLDVYKAASTN